MNASDSDTIAAIASPSGRGGVGIIRVSGSKARTIAAGVLGDVPPTRRAVLRKFCNGTDETLDEGIALLFTAPKSFTGEDVLELHGHGGPVVLDRVLARVLELGARPAHPGEFSRRAFLNEKLDLTQAEAIADLIDSSSVESARAAIRSLQGEFSTLIHSLTEAITETRMHVEAAIDFPEEEIDFISRGNIAEKLERIRQQLQTILQQARQGNLLREGIQVVLVGQPNVGKSSLMNRLVGEEVAIVTPVAGTTRDTIKNTIHIKGIPIHVVDTAGLRDTSDEVEQHGIARTWRALEKADAALILIDAAQGITPAEKTVLDRLPSVLPKIWVHNKIDLQGEKPQTLLQGAVTHIYLSAKTGAGVDLLQEALLKIAGWQPAGGGIFMARARHLQALQQVGLHLQQALERLDQPELAAEELRLAQESLGTITGKFSPDDLLDRIFSRFCIGK